MSWTVIFYETENGKRPVEDFLESLSNTQNTKISRVISHIKQYGLQSVIPHLKKLSGLDMWEIRVLGKDNMRVLYVVPQKENILLLHGFIKKTQKTQLKEIRIALIRFQDWKKRLDK